MSDILPPVPYDMPATSFEWVDWYEKLRKTINTTGLNHNDLQNMQGGNATERYHLTLAESQKVTQAVTNPSGTLTTTTTVTNGAAAAAGTLLNAPVAGNPTKWLRFNDNGTIRYIPSW